MAQIGQFRRRRLASPESAGEDSLDSGELSVGSMSQCQAIKVGADFVAELEPEVAPVQVGVLCLLLDFGSLSEWASHQVSASLFADDTNVPLGDTIFSFCPSIV
jgi:hypothetical protein